jgi:hypothetical protein
MLVSALASLLSDALERPNSRHLADDQFRSDLGGLVARANAELDALSGRRPLRLADDPADSVSDD